mgnify:CR=1 FL=1
MPFIIAEIGVNHEGSMVNAKKMIDQAKAGGANAVKFQSYKAETLASKNSQSYWDLNKEPTVSQFELFKKYDSFWKNEFEELKLYCDKINIEFISTAFDIESANFLNEIMDVFKIASSDLTNKPLIKHICEFGKPIILSTGASTLEEIKETVSWIAPYKVHLSLLHCVLNYPTSNGDARLKKIKELKEYFPNYLIGYSDHTLPQEMTTCILAALLGAKIVEKHFTFDKSIPGNDHYHSMDENDLKQFTSTMSLLDQLYKSDDFDNLTSQHKAILNARRSLVTTKAIKAGTILNQEHLTFKRPGTGISPKDIDVVIGKKLLLDLQEDQKLQWEMINIKSNE